MINRIRKVIERLAEWGVLAETRDNCLGMSKIVQTMLQQQGISSHMVECELTIVSNNPPMLIHIGHGRPERGVGLMDTHVILITDTEPPYLIDSSIGHITMPHRLYVLEQLSANNEYELEGNKWIYREKEVNRFPIILQGNMLDRIIQDKKVLNDILWLKAGLAVAISLLLLDLALRLV